MSNEAQFNSSPVINDFLNFCSEEAAPFVGEIKLSRQLDPPLFNEAADLLLNLAKISLGNNFPKQVVSGYRNLMIDTIKCQMRYEASGHYESSSYAEVRARTYDSGDFMNLYHWGVFVETFGWRHHLKMLKMFRDDFISRLESEERPLLLDLGCGSGVWHFLAQHFLPKLSILGVDISDTSIAIVRNLVAQLKKEDSISYVQADATSYESDQLFDAGICCLLLEHLEKPEDIFKVFQKALNPRGYAFVSCALTAAEVSHIHEFKDELEVAALAVANGFRVLHMQSFAPDNFPAGKKYLPRSLAMIIQKKVNEIW